MEELVEVKRIWALCPNSIRVEIYQVTLSSNTGNIDQYVSCQCKSNIISVFVLNREQGQGTVDELRSRDFRKELEERESKGSSSNKSIPAVVRRAIEANTSSAKKAKLDQSASSSNLDQDDPVDADSSSDSDSDDDDDTAALLEELNKIKRERAQDNAKKEQEKKQEDERIRMENILSGNPLLSYSSGAKADLRVSDFDD